MITSFCFLAIAIQAKKPLVLNSEFDNGLNGWVAEGNVLVANQKLVIGHGKGAVRQKYVVPGLRVLYYGATLEAKDLRIRLRCFDKMDHLLMDLSAGADKDNKAGIYLKTHAYTSYAMLSIEKISEDGEATADDVVLRDDGVGRVLHKPDVDLDLMMRPFWKGRRVENESILLLSSKGAAPEGRLLFAPKKILSVRDSSLRTTFVRGKDYKIDGRKLIVVAGSKIPRMGDFEFAKGQYPWTELQGRHVFITYEHSEKWRGPIPQYQGRHLLETIAKLKARKPLTMVAYGDSITLGMNVSGFLNVPPYLPPWPSLAANRLEKVYGSKVKLYNTALGGATSQWAKDNAYGAVATLKPDLVILAFGMNDFWSLEPKYFIANIKDTIATIRKANPDCEFLLIGSMRFDPAYTTEHLYVSNLAGYPGELRKLVGKGIGLLDMTDLTDALYKAKSQRDLATDPMHPNDFLARIYAQSIVASLARS